LKRNRRCGAAFLVGAEGAIASLDCACAHTTEIIDIWRKQGDRFVHSWEDRFVNVHGYIDNTLPPSRGCLQKAARLQQTSAKQHCMHRKRVRSVK